MRFLCKRREFIALLGVEASASAMSAVTRSQQSRMPVEGYLAGGLQAHLLAILVIATLIVLAGTAGAREFRAADDQLEDYPTVQALQFMSRLIEERTGGRHRIRVFHSAQLGDESQTIEQTRLGAIETLRGGSPRSTRLHFRSYSARPTTCTRHSIKGSVTKSWPAWSAMDSS